LGDQKSRSEDQRLDDPWIRKKKKKRKKKEGA